MATNFFKDLYKADNGVQPNIITDNIQAQISQDINVVLCKEYTDKDIGDALFQIGPLKATGRDGFPARFYRRHLGVFKDDIIAAVFQERENAWWNK